MGRRKRDIRTDDDNGGLLLCVWERIPLPIRPETSRYCVCSNTVATTKPTAESTASKFTASESTASESATTESAAPESTDASRQCHIISNTIAFTSTDTAKDCDVHSRHCRRHGCNFLQSPAARV